MTENSNPKVTPLLHFLTLLNVVVLSLAGLGLFFIPKIAGAFWPWALLPFNARFLGGVYTAALAAAAMQFYFGRWSPARIVTPMIFIFTTIMVSLSLIHIDQFDFKRFEVWLWFIFYVVLPVSTGYHLWLYRNFPPADPTPPTKGWRTVLLIQTIILGLYGMALLIAPSVAKIIWSWKIDDFHAQLYSVTFITPAVGGFLLTKAASKAEWLTMGVIQGVLGLLPVVAVIIVDASVKGVNWSALTTWIWIALFAAMFGVSLAMIKESQTTRT